MPQPQPRQQSRLNDIQMLQRHIMFKQLQELQRQQQIQELGGARQQNYIDQQTMINKQASGPQLPPLINGTPIHDTSQMFMAGNVNLVQGGASPLVQGFPNGMVFSQAQSQAPRSMGLVSQQLDVSLYGTPIASSGNNFNQFSHLQRATHDSANVLTKGNNNQAEKPIMQSSAFSNSFTSDQCNMPDGALVSKQVFQEKNLFGQVPIQGLHDGDLPGNFQQVNTLQGNASVQEFGRRQDRAGWPGLFPGKTTNIVPSQGLASLDPLEQKILFNMDDNSWEASFGRHSNMSTGGLENTLAHTDPSTVFPSVQSGSWSALMQSAVAEASSSDTGIQEEWSGLSFQNPELSTDNQPLNFFDSRKQQTNWIDNNLQSASAPSLKPEIMFNNSNSSSFLGFQQSGIPFSLKQKEGMRSDSSHESIQQSPKNITNWLDCNPQQNQPIEGGQPVQRLSPLQSAWPGQDYEHSKTDAHQQSNHDINGAAHKNSDSPWKTDDNHLAGSFSDSVVPQRHLPDYMKHVDISQNKGNVQHQLINSPQIFAHTSKGASETYKKRENCFKRENSTDSYHSNASQHTITGHELRENVWIYESNSRSVAEGNQKPSGQVPRGMSNQEQGYAGQFKFIGDVSNDGMDFEKGCLPDIQRNFRESEEVPPRSNVGSNTSAFFDRSAGFHGSKVTEQTSQHILELLHKVDKSTEYRPGMHFGPTDSTSLSEVPQAETPDPSIAQSYNKSSASKCFGLRLAPPSQRLPNSNCFDSPQSSPQTGNSAATFPSGPPHVRNQFQNEKQSATPIAGQSPLATVPGMGNRFPDFNSASSQDTSHLICTNPFGQQFSILEPKPVTQPSVTLGMTQQVGFSTRSPNVWTNVPTQQNLSGTQSGKVPFSFLPSPDSANSSLETASAAPQELRSQNYFSQEFSACSMNSQALDSEGEQLGKERSSQQISQRGKLSHGQESLAKHLSEANAVACGSSVTSSHQQGFDKAQYGGNQAPAISARDLEAFGRSLTPSHVPPQNYSLLNQVHAMKNVETDPSMRVSENYNGVDSDQNVQQVIAMAGQQLSYGHNSGVRKLVNSELNMVSQKSGDNKMLSFSSDAGGDRSVKASLLQDTSQEMVTYGQNNSQNHSISNNEASNRTEQSPIGLQMAPYWFKHYGTLKNGQMLPMYDARTTKNAAPQFSLGNPFENLCMNGSMVQGNPACAIQVSSVWQTTATTTVAVKHLSPPYVWPPNVNDQNLAVLRPKKRKIAASELLPWHKEVTQGTQRLQNISMAELEWALAVNRLIEKVKDEGEMIEDTLPMLRPKKRLRLTTQLMQQLFRPASAVILSEDATSNCDSVVYFTARLALADACSLTSYFHMPCDISNMSSEEPKTCERISDQDFSKSVEDFLNQSKRLEGDLLRLDKRASIVDLRMESQELEKFSVINRFAKFHSRGLAGAAETSTSSGTTPAVLKTFPQRYVTALPMPRTVPEGAQCLSL